MGRVAWSGISNIATMSERIKKLIQDKKKIEGAIKLKKQVLNTHKQQLDGFKKERGKKGEIRLQLEKKLKKFGIDRPSNHGGNLTGVKVRVLLQHINVIFGVE